MHDDLNFALSLKKDLDENQLEVHIKIQQRNGRKCITFVEGLNFIDKTDPDFMEKISKQFRKSFNCASTFKKAENIIQLQGDHRQKIKEYLVNHKLIEADKIKIHGI